MYMAERRYGPHQPERGIHDEPDPEMVEILDEFIDSDEYRFPEIDEAYTAEREKQQRAKDAEEPGSIQSPSESSPPQEQSPRHE
jgi:hypothetical protein